MLYKFILMTLLTLTLSGVLLFTVGKVQANPNGTTINVNTTTDELNNDGDCSLREAIVAANQDGPVDACPAGSGNDTIQLQPAIYTLTLGPEAGDDYAEFGDLDIRANLTIVGKTIGLLGTYIDGNTLDRVFEVHMTAANVEFKNMVIRNGYNSYRGGGIYARSNTNVRVRNSSVSKNTVAGSGGGIYVESGANLTLSNSSAKENKSLDRFGGGIYIEAGGSTILNDSSISGNAASGENGVGGGIYNEGTFRIYRGTINGNKSSQNGAGVYNFGTAILVNATISGNDGEGIAQFSTGAVTHLYNTTISANGTGVWNNVAGGEVPVITLRNSILAGNLGPDCHGKVTSNGRNLIGNSDYCGPVDGINGDIVGSQQAPINPKLGALASNGGMTHTHALLSGSPAIEKGNPGGCLSELATQLGSDQRGNARHVDGDNNGVARCDMGAYEYGSNAPPATATSIPTSTPAPTSTPPGNPCTSNPAKPAPFLPANHSTASTRKVLLDWNDVPCTVTYKIKVRLNAKNGVVVDKAKGLNVSQYTTKKLDRGHTYFWKVKACNSFGCTGAPMQSFILPQ